jgi:hypothetical protein
MTHIAGKGATKIARRRKTTKPGENTRVQVLTGGGCIVQVGALILCHTRELAYQICHEFERFSTYLPDARVGVVFGGLNIQTQKEAILKDKPNIIVGTPGRVKAVRHPPASLAPKRPLGISSVVVGSRGPNSCTSAAVDTPEQRYDGDVQRPPVG